MKCGKFLSPPVLSVFLVLGFVYYITVFIFIADWLGLQSSAGSLNSLIFTFLASFTIFSFFVCVLTDPGGVPSAYVPDVEDGEVSDQEPKKSGVQLRHCDKCCAYKPPRAHHCRSCKRCILRMDHHCMWINNCVGHRNYKAFFILVLYATMASIYSSVAIVSCAAYKGWNFTGQLPLKVFYIFSGFTTVGLSLTLGTLLGWHIYLVTHNMTTIEYFEATRAAWLARKSGQSYRHPFDVGFYKNIALVLSLCSRVFGSTMTYPYMLKSFQYANVVNHLHNDQVLGPDMLKWLCPTAVNHIKDGITFPTLRDSS